MTATLRDYLWKMPSQVSPVIGMPSPYDIAVIANNGNPPQPPIPESENPFFPREVGGERSWTNDNKLKLDDNDTPWSGKSGYLELVVKPQFKVKVKVETDNDFFFSDIGTDFIERFNIERSFFGGEMTFWMQKGDAIFISVDAEDSPSSVVEGLSGGNTTTSSTTGLWSVDAGFILVLNDYEETQSAFSVAIGDPDEPVWFTLLEVEYDESEEGVFFDPNDIPNPDNETPEGYVPESLIIHNQDNWRVVVYHQDPFSQWEVILNGTTTEMFDTKDEAIEKAYELAGEAPEPDPDYNPPQDPDDETGIPFVVVALLGLLLLGGLVWVVARRRGN